MTGMSVEEFNAEAKGVFPSQKKRFRSLAGLRGKSLRAFLPQQLFEIGNSLRQAFAQLHPWRPGEVLLRRFDVRTALLRIIMRKRPIHDLGRGSRQSPVRRVA